MNESVVRLSLGTAILLGLRNGSMEARPSTAYIMIGENCQNNCAFCTQARDADSRTELLSRVTWPEYPISEVIDRLSKTRGTGLGRICLQCLNDPGYLAKVPRMVGLFHEASGLPISVSVGPMSTEALAELKRRGADRVGIALDGASERIFDMIKGKCVGNPHSWDSTWNAISNALEIFGKEKVSTHVIIGLGETDIEVFQVLKKARDKGVTVSLFAYTPVRGTMFKGARPSIRRYRALQILRFSVIEYGITDGIDFNEEGSLIRLESESLVDLPGFDDSFRTRGCPDCNRPYYNERPGGPMFNFPQPIPKEQVEESLKEARKYMEEKASDL